MKKKKLLIRSDGRMLRCQSGSFKLKMKLTLPMAAKKKKKFDVDTNKIKKKWNLPISSVGSESIAATVST